MSRAEIEIGMSEMINRLRNASIHLPRDNRDYAVEVGLRHLLERKVLVERDGVFVPDPDEADLLQFYANSIRHLLPANTPDFAANAKENAATAGS
jgi:glycerol-3-phosphate O-acyltransferase